MSEPKWVAIARNYIGQREVHGAPTSPVIASWLQKLGAWWKDDETPWCGTFVAAVLQESGLPFAKAFYRAKAWLDWGQRLDMPALGCVVVFDRQGGGHVAFVVGRDNNGRLLCLGGNQGDAVSVVPFEQSRVLGYRWPSGMPKPALATLPVIASAAKSSSNEA